MMLGRLRIYPIGGAIRSQGWCIFLPNKELQNHRILKITGRLSYWVSVTFQGQSVKLRVRVFGGFFSAKSHKIPISWPLSPSNIATKKSNIKESRTSKEGQGSENKCSWEGGRVYIYIPRTQLTFIFGGQPSKTRPELQSKQGAPFGFQVYIYMYSICQPWMDNQPLCVDVFSRGGN